MNTKLKVTTLFIVTTFMVFLSGCVKDNPDYYYSKYCDHTGVVKDYTGLDGCSWIIELDNGEKLEPVSFNTNGLSFSDGQRVSVSYTELNAASYCMVGKVVRIDCIESLVCQTIETIYEFLSFTDDNILGLYDLKISGDCLEMAVTYSGGCEQHLLKLIHFGPTCGTPPIPPIQLRLFHDSNGDNCEALIKEYKSFDLSRFKDEYSSSVKFEIHYKTSSGIESKIITYNY